MNHGRRHRGGDKKETDRGRRTMADLPRQEALIHQLIPEGGKLLGRLCQLCLARDEHTINPDGLRLNDDERRVDHSDPILSPQADGRRSPAALS